MLSVLPLVRALFKGFVLILAVSAISCFGQTLKKVEFVDDAFVYAHAREFYLMEDGTLYGVGQNGMGELGLDASYIYRPFDVIMEDVKDVAVGLSHTLVLKNDGSLWGFGSNSSGELGLGHRDVVSEPIQILDAGVGSIGAAEYCSFYVKTDRTVWAMGKSYLFGENSSDDSYDVPIELALDGVRSVHAGLNYVLFRMSDWSWRGRHAYLNPRDFGGSSIDDSTFWTISEQGTVLKFETGQRYALSYDRYGVYEDIGHDAPSFSWNIREDVKSVSPGVGKAVLVTEGGALWESGKREATLSEGVDKAFVTLSGGIIIVKDDQKTYVSGLRNYVTGVLNFKELILPDPPIARAGASVFVEDKDGDGSESVGLDASMSRYAGDEATYTWRWGEEEYLGKVVSGSFPIGKTSVVLAVEDSRGNIDEDELIVEVFENGISEELDENPRVEKIEVGLGVDYIVRSDGSLWVVGSSYDGLLLDGVAGESRDGIEFGRDDFYELMAFGVADVTAGGLLLMADGSVRSLVGSGVVGHDYRLETIVEMNAVSISGDYRRGVILMEDGAVYEVERSRGWGIDAYNTFTKVIETGCVRVENSSGITFFHMQDGSIWAKTRNFRSDGDYVDTDVELMFESGYDQAVYGALKTWLISDDGRLFRTDKVPYRGYGERSESFELEEMFPLGDGVRYQSIYVSEYMFFLVTKDGGVYVASAQGDYANFEDEEFAEQPMEFSKVFDGGIIDISVWGTRAFFLKEDGSMWGMGHNIEDWMSRECLGCGVDSGFKVATSPLPFEFDPTGPLELIPSPESLLVAYAGVDVVAVTDEEQGTGTVRLSGESLDDFGAAEDWNWTWSGGAASGQVVEIELDVGIHQVEVEVVNRFETQDADEVRVHVYDRADVLEWLNQYFSDSEIEEMGDSFAQLDSDEDDIPNLVELLLNSNPADKSSGVVPEIAYSNGSASLVVPNYGGEQPGLLFSSDLSRWYRTPNISVLEGWDVYTIELPAISSAFYKVNLDVPKVQRN